MVGTAAVGVNCTQVFTVGSQSSVVGSAVSAAESSSQSGDSGGLCCGREGVVGCSLAFDSMSPATLAHSPFDVPSALSAAPTQRREVRVNRSSSFIYYTFVLPLFTLGRTSRKFLEMSPCELPT